MSAEEGTEEGGQGTRPEQRGLAMLRNVLVMSGSGLVLFSKDFGHTISQVSTSAAPLSRQCTGQELITHCVRICFQLVLSTATPDRVASHGDDELQRGDHRDARVLHRAEQWYVISITFSTS